MDSFGKEAFAPCTGWDGERASDFFGTFSSSWLIRVNSLRMLGSTAQHRLISSTRSRAAASSMAPERRPVGVCPVAGGVLGVNARDCGGEVATLLGGYFMAATAALDDVPADVLPERGPWVDGPMLRGRNALKIGWVPLATMYKAISSAP